MNVNLRKYPKSTIVVAAITSVLALAAQTPLFTAPTANACSLTNPVTGAWYDEPGACPSYLDPPVQDCPGYGPCQPPDLITPPNPSLNPLVPCATYMDPTTCSSGGSSDSIMPNPPIFNVPSNSGSVLPGCLLVSLQHCQAQVQIPNRMLDTILGGISTDNDSANKYLDCLLGLRLC